MTELNYIVGAVSVLSVNSHCKNMDYGISTQTKAALYFVALW